VRRASTTPLPRSARPFGFAALAVAAALTGCKPYVEGNCVNGSEVRTPTQTFQGLRVESAIQATVNAGAAQPKLVVSGDANLLPYIHAEVVPDPGSVPAGVLRLWIEVPAGNFSICIPPLAVLDTGELSYVGAEGDSHVDLSGLATPLLSVEASGKSAVNVAGAGGGRIQVVASDATVDAAAYPVTAGAQVDLTSGARAELHSDAAVAGTAGAGCTLYNFGKDACTAVVASGTPPPTVLCPVP